MNDTILFHSDGETAAQTVTDILVQQGYRVIRSFDLRSALMAHLDCTCPDHGTSHCTCQFVVLLVYGDTTDPVVVTVHSYDAQTRLRIVQDALTRLNAPLVGRIMAALAESVQAGPATADQPME